MRRRKRWVPYAIGTGTVFFIAGAFTVAYQGAQTIAGKWSIETDQRSTEWIEFKQDGTYLDRYEYHHRGKMPDDPLLTKGNYGFGGSYLRTVETNRQNSHGKINYVGPRVELSGLIWTSPSRIIVTNEYGSQTYDRLR